MAAMVSPAEKREWNAHVSAGDDEVLGEAKYCEDGD
jgi:hypothetical protein